MDKENIKIINNTCQYVNSVFTSYTDLHKIMSTTQEELTCFSNDLNFRPVSAQIIESYNVIICHMFDRINSTFEHTVYDRHVEIQIIKPVNVASKRYTSPIELEYFIKNGDSKTLFVGNFSHANVTKIDTEITLYRTSKTYSFTLLDLVSDISMTTAQLREKIDLNLGDIKSLVAMFYSDMEHTKASIGVILELITDLIRQSISCYYKQWQILLQKIDNIISEMNKKLT
jgi:hypothetical protein